MKPFDVVRIPFFSPEECIQIKEYANEKYNQFKNSDLSLSMVSKDQVTTSNYDNYNFFRDNPQYIERLSETLHLHIPWLARPLLVQSWVNIYKKGQGIGWHNHAGTHRHSYTANVFIDGLTDPGLQILEPGTNKTWYIPNEIGEMMIMNSDTFHSVPPNESDVVRYTVGMTIHSYFAITPDILSGAAINRSGSQIIIA